MKTINTETLICYIKFIRETFIFAGNRRLIKKNDIAVLSNAASCN